MTTGVCQGCGGPTPMGQNGKPLKWCTPECRRNQYREPCPECGKLMGGSEGRGPNAPKLCLVCNGRSQGQSMQDRYREYGDARDGRIIELMAEDATDQEIAEELGYTKATVSQLIWRLRRRGVPLPVRKKGRRRAIV